jgi:hypothetical protein
LETNIFGDEIPYFVRTLYEKVKTRLTGSKVYLYFEGSNELRRLAKVERETKARRNQAVAFEPRQVN